MVEYIAAILLSLGTAFVLRSYGLRSLDRVIEALADLIGGWRGDGWPRGVQEEDRDTPWGRIRRSLGAKGPVEPPAPRPKLVRVQPTIRTR
jgi:hypothetical protein